MLWSRPPPAIRKPTDQKEIKGDLMLMGSVGQELHHLEKERAIQTDREETRRRRTIQLNRKDSQSGSWGFTLQTYGIKNKRSGEVEVMTYVDYVELHGPAWIAGMRKGDVLLSVNGESVEGYTHPNLVSKIQTSGDILRLVVLFEDCCRKVELYERFIKLKRILSQKMRDLRQLEMQEKMIRSGDRLSRLSLFRDSIRSSTSSDWDRYSELASPGALDVVPPNQRAWRQRFFARSTETLDTSSELSYGCASPFSSSRESLSLRASHESLSQKNSTASSEKASDIFEGASGGAEVCLGAEASPPDAKFYIGRGDINGDAHRLRRPAENSDHDSPYIGRKRSNSALLNDMRMKLIADSVNTVTEAQVMTMTEDVCVSDSENDIEDAENEQASDANSGKVSNDAGIEPNINTQTQVSNEVSSVLNRNTQVQVRDDVSNELNMNTQVQVSNDACIEQSMNTHVQVGNDVSKEPNMNTQVPVSNDVSSELSMNTRVQETEARPPRLYQGVRINDSDENTRL